MFSTIRKLVEAVERLTKAVNRLWVVQDEALPSMKRLDALELSRAQFEADMNGLVMKAEGKLKAAANSEARERTMKKSYENELDPFDPEGEEVRGDLPAGYVEAGEAEGLPPVRVDVETDYKTLALRAKFS